MTERDEDDPLKAVLQQWSRETVESHRQDVHDAGLLDVLDVLCRLVEKLYDRLDVELAEIRDGLVELDHKTVARRAFEELHTRVDRLEAR